MENEVKNENIDVSNDTSNKTKQKKSKAPLIIILCVVLICAGLGAYYVYKQNNKTEEVIVEKIEVDPTIKVIEDKTAPEILLSKDSYTMYVGNTEYDFGVETYDDYGEVEVTYDDSNVDYNTAGTYEVTINATDKSGNTSSVVATLNVENKPIVTKTVTKNVYVNSGSSSSDSSSSNEGSSNSGSNSSGSVDTSQVEADTKALCDALNDDSLWVEGFKGMISLDPSVNGQISAFVQKYGFSPNCGKYW